jgi:hypothetical protein
MLRSLFANKTHLLVAVGTCVRQGSYVLAFLCLHFSSMISISSRSPVGKKLGLAARQLIVGFNLLCVRISGAA